MIRKRNRIGLLLVVAMLLSGCAMRTVDEMYAPPRRSAEHMDLQRAIDSAMTDLEYCAPLTGENQQTVQMADLNGDGNEEYLLFAKGNSDNPMKILIFTRQDGSCQLTESIESRGSSFEFVEYADIDEADGKELVVGLGISDQVDRHMAVYSFADGDVRQLMAVNYNKVVTADLDVDGCMELLAISAGESDEENAAAVVYSYSDGAMVRSEQSSLSAGCDQIKRIMVSSLHGGTPAVYVASAVDESAIITDVFALRNGQFTNISLSNESGTSVKTLRNYYVYADDIDEDGVLELPSLIYMEPVQNTGQSAAQQLIRWYAMKDNGEEVDKLYTFHNFNGGWYLKLDSAWAQRVSVTQDGAVFTFFLWDADFTRAEKLFSIYALSGSNREQQATQDDRFPLLRTESVVYAAKLEVASLAYGIDQQTLTEGFHLIHMDWKNGEM